MPFATSLLREARRNAGLKTGQFAELAEYDRNALVNVEGRLKPASREAFARFAAILNVPVEHLIDEAPAEAGAA